ncbi:hypothetical protein E2C01_088132 [Portunus trituberculatus]|uniref:Uncharacterized protein n=1 Tax=Portunus trituberculatus TaxID=210409 RepID=A0A5B7JID6_PORTR|nr:hypothetical protein [Portunus trituberculatus]
MGKRRYFFGNHLSQSPPARKPLSRVRKPNLHSDRGQNSNACAWRPLGPQRTHGFTVPTHLRSTRSVIWGKPSWLTAGGVGVARPPAPPPLVATGASVSKSRRVSLMSCPSSGVWNPPHRKYFGHRERNPGNPTRHRQHRARDGCDIGLLR